MDENKKFGEKIVFKVENDLLEYGIEEEVNTIAKTLDSIYKKSNSVAVIDLLKDISETVNFEDLMVDEAKGSED